MKNLILILVAALLWNCTDYADDWEDRYGTAFAAVENQSSSAVNVELPIYKEKSSESNSNGWGNGGWYPGVQPFSSSLTLSSSSQSSSSRMPESSAGTAGNQQPARLVLWNIDAYNNGRENVDFIDYYDETGSEIVWHDFYECGGICGTVYLWDLNRELYSDPYVGIYLGIPKNTYSWSGVCITYTSDIPSRLEMDLGDRKEKELEYNIPAVPLTNSGNIAEECFKWSDFEQPYKYGVDESKLISGDDASAYLSGISFVIQAADQSEGDFVISKIYLYQ